MSVVLSTDNPEIKSAALRPSKIPVIKIRTIKALMAGFRMPPKKYKTAVMKTQMVNKNATFAVAR